MSQTRDLYEVLEVPRDASQEEIRKAYRRLAREHHPDVSADPEAEHRIKEINLAYQTLSDPARRRQYDTYGGEGFTPDMFDVMGDVSDIFEMFFGSPFRRGGRSPRPARGEDLRLSLTLAFEEAVFGVEKEIEVETLASCDGCDGTGRAPGTEAVRCSRCEGNGEVSDVRRSVFGTVMTSRICSACGGGGEQIPSPCPTCRGEGRVPRRRTIKVEVPAGVDDGVELRIEGSGHQGRRGTPPGHLYLGLGVRPHPVFERRGQDLAAVLEVQLTQAILGGEVEIETLDGPETLRIPAGTKPGTVVRMGGRGVPNLGRRGRGDLYVQLDVVVPERLSRKERALVEELAELRGEPTGKDVAPARLRRP
ncbi:MAG TPA: molecular chaperone DnaJ [Actinomycetota bacterium]|nr:molecular chaperone DnaJ [Actinomycetota bacterium]